MKSITKKISLLATLAIMLFLSSCLDSGSNSYIGQGEFAYIARGEKGVVYARTQSKLYITSPEIKNLNPGEIVNLSFQVDFDEDTQILVEENIAALEVQLGGEIEHIEKERLQLMEAPDDSDEPIMKFEMVRNPLYAQDKYFGDRYVFYYTYKAKKGENVNVSFYKASDEDAEAEDTDALIDVWIEKTGTPEDDASEEMEGEYIAANLEDLRYDLSDKADEDGKATIKFRYHSTDSKQPIVFPSPSQPPYFMLIND